jgi:acyl dehydratase
MLLYASISSCVSDQFPDFYPLSQELIFPNPTYAGEPIRIHLTITEDDILLENIDVASTITRADGTLTCQSLTRLARLPYTPQPGSAERSTVPSEAREWKGLSLGQRALTQRGFNGDDLSAYCALVGEHSRLYTDGAYARKNGFKDTPVPGALLGGMFSYLLGTRLPGRGTNWLKQKLYFPEAVYSQEEITASVEVVRLRPEKDLVNLQTVSVNPQGSIVCRGDALVLVKDLEI